VLPISPRAIVGVVKEMRATTDRPLLVAGVLAAARARARRRGRSSAVRTGGSPEDVAALLYVIGDAVTEEDEQVCSSSRNRAPRADDRDRAGRETPLRIPFVLATDAFGSSPGTAFRSTRSRGRSPTSSAEEGDVFGPAPARRGALRSAHS